MDLHTRGAEEAFDGFHENREAESQEEDAVDKRGKNLRSVPTIGVPSVGMCLGGKLRWESVVREQSSTWRTHLDCIQSNYQARHITLWLR